MIFFNKSLANVKDDLYLLNQKQYIPST